MGAHRSADTLRGSLAADGHVLTTGPGASSGLFLYTLHALYTGGCQVRVYVRIPYVGG